MVATTDGAAIMGTMIARFFSNSAIVRCVEVSYIVPFFSCWVGSSREWVHDPTEVGIGKWIYLCVHSCHRRSIDQLTSGRIALKLQYRNIVAYGASNVYDTSRCKPFNGSQESLSECFFLVFILP